MLVALIASCSLVQASAADFFPLQEGTRFTYSADKLAKEVSIDEVKAAIQIEGLSATPVFTLENGRKVDQKFYRVTDDGVYIVAFAADQPLSSPQPVFKIGPGVTKWKYEGLTPNGPDFEPIKLEGQSRLKGKAQVFGQEVEVLEVKITATIGADKRSMVTVKQEAEYAKGIGLIKMVSNSKDNRGQYKSTVELIKVVPPKKDGS